MISLLYMAHRNGCRHTIFIPAEAEALPCEGILALVSGYSSNHLCEYSGLVRTGPELGLVWDCGPVAASPVCMQEVQAMALTSVQDCFYCLWHVFRACRYQPSVVRAYRHSPVDVQRHLEHLTRIGCMS